MSTDVQGSVTRSPPDRRAGSGQR